MSSRYDVKLGYPLSRREVQIVNLLVAGLKMSEAANELGLSHDTVKCYLGRIAGKLGCPQRVQSVVSHIASRQVQEVRDVLAEVERALEQDGDMFTALDAIKKLNASHAAYLQSA